MRLVFSLLRPYLDKPFHFSFKLAEKKLEQSETINKSDKLALMGKFIQIMGFLMPLQRELIENENEVNQLSKDALTKTGQKPNPGKLYWLQLVRWALVSGKLIGFNHHLLLFLELLEGSDPKTAMNFLEGNERARRMGLTTQEKWDPVDLSRLLLIHLDCCMTEKVDGYSKIHARDSSHRSPAKSKIA
jgi:hypothetical protein